MNTEIDSQTEVTLQADTTLVQLANRDIRLNSCLLIYIVTMLNLMFSNRLLDFYPPVFIISFV